MTRRMASDPMGRGQSEGIFVDGMRLQTAWATAVVVVLAGCATAPGAPPGATASPSGSSPPQAVEVERPPADSPDVAALAAGLNAVGFDLFTHAASGSDQDVVLSPLSIGLAFGMADVGATDQTADALSDLFAYPADGQDRWSAFNTLEQTVTDVGAPVVRLANREFPDVSFGTVADYDETLARWFGAGIEPLRLRDDPDGSREHINQWVADRTEGLIEDLVPDGMINSNSVMLLVNALYLQADWATPFGKYPTEDAPFTRLDGSQVTVPLMHELELHGPAVATDTYAATEIPYEDGDLSMLVIVPADGNYEQVEQSLSSELIAQIDEAVSEANVELWLPRFESDSRMDLRDAFESGLGVDGLFGSGGGWDGIAPGITLESGVHAADISVDEQGTVAAAATALGFQDSGPPEPDVTVRADRPFLYLIRHQPTGMVLFVGRVTDPAA